MPEMDFALNKVTLRATVEGAGDPVLLLHAGGERRGVWAPIADLLGACGLRTIAVDLRGHGDSGGQPITLCPLARDVAEIIRREVSPVIVVGASLGGFAAIAALAEPSIRANVAGLVLVDVVPDPDPGRVRHWLSAQTLDGRHTELTEDILSSGPELLATTAELDLPILLVRGGHSPLTDADVDRLQSTNSRVAIVCVASAGHLVARDAPAELASIISGHAESWFCA